MGLLIDGKWHDEWYDTKASGGSFVRSESQFRHWIGADSKTFPAAVDRYDLYVSLACPWAHRTLIFRKLKGLEAFIDVFSVHWLMKENGWSFEAGPGVVADSNCNADHMHQIYTTADPGYSGRVTVPVLWDKTRQTMVNNESSEIIRMFNSAFDEIGAKPGDYWPIDLRDEIEKVNHRVYHTLNNGVYKCGFATTQSAYDAAVVPLFETLDWLDSILERQAFLCGDVITEADWRLFTTLIRFDAVYLTHFKCNKKPIADYPNLSNYTRQLYQWPGIAETVNFEHIIRHYYESHPTVNPHGIVPIGPDLDFDLPHNR